MTQFAEDMHGLMTDPTDREVDNEDDYYNKPEFQEANRRGIRRRCGMASLSLVMMWFIAYSMFNSSDCTHGTTSGQPFALVHEVPGRYGSCMLMATFATVTALFYPIAVARKPRPRFLHVAGAYLVVNAVTLCSEVTTVWAGCADVDWIRSTTAFICLVGFAVSFVLLQHSILVKVEALDVNAREDELAAAPLRKAYNLMLNPFTLGFGLLSGVVPVGLVGTAGSMYHFTIFIQALFLVFFLGLLLNFTAIATREMREVLQGLDAAEMDMKKKAKLRNHLAMHSLCTMGANMTAIVFFASIVFDILQQSKAPGAESFLCFCYAVDVIANTTCALTLSGLGGAVCRRNGGVSLIDEKNAEAGLGPSAGPVQQLQAAGHAASQYSEVAE